MSRYATRDLEHVRGPMSSRLLIEVGRERGAAPERLLAGTGLSVEALRSDDSRVSGHQELRIAENLVRELEDTVGVGIEAGRRMTTGDLGIWAFALLSSQTYGKALHIGLRYMQLTPAFVRARRDDTDSETLVTLHDEHLPTAARDLLAERDLAATAGLLRTLSGRAPGLTLETRFSGLRVRKLKELYGDVEILSDQPAHRMRIPAHLIALPLPLADATTRAICERECERLLESQPHRTPLAAIVRSRLVRTPSDMPSFEDIAAELHMSSRSLRRRLADEGSTYRSLREEVATALAIELLSVVGLTVGEVADRLGYRDQTSFAHAFTRWTGTPPSTHRRGAPHSPLR